MATTLPSDMKIYNDQFWAGYTEVVAQNLNAFNGNSANAIRLSSALTAGQFKKEAFLAKVSGLVTRRDETSDSAVTALKGVSGEIVKVDRSVKIGPVQYSDAALRRQGVTADEYAFLLGQQAAADVLKDQLDSAVYGLNGAFGVSGMTTNLEYDGSASTITHGVLNSGMAKMGDAANNIVAWVMHSAVYHQLVGQAITDKITNVADVTIYGGMPGTFGRPVVVTDSDALFSNGSSSVSTDNVYYTYGLVAGAADVEESASQTMEFERVTGLENLVTRMQGETAYTLGLKGMAFSTGTANPTQAQLATGSNWAKVGTSYKDLVGIRVKTKKTNALG